MFKRALALFVRCGFAVWRRRSTGARSCSCSQVFRNRGWRLLGLYCFVTRAEPAGFITGFVGICNGMSKSSPPLNLPDDVARMAAAQVTAGRFPNVEAVVRAGVRAIERDQDKLEAVRAALIEGEESGIAEPGSFDRARTLIRERAAARRQP